MRRRSLPAPSIARQDAPHNASVIGRTRGGGVEGSGTTERGLGLGELLAAVSLATDLAHDVPAESALRDAVLAVELARLAGWSEPDLSDVFYLALLYHIGCTGAVAAQSRLGAGDDVTVRRWMSEVDYTDRPQMFRIVATRLAPKWGGPANWAPAMAAFATAERDLPDALASTAEAAVRLSQRLGASPRVTESLRHAHGRWDGRVFPTLPSGEGLSATARLVHLVHVAQNYHQMAGVEAADDVVRRRSGAEFDPELARLWLQNSHDLLRSVPADSVWDQALFTEPEPRRRVSRAHLDDVCSALADFVDLASPFTAGILPASRAWPRLRRSTWALTRKTRRRRGAPGRSTTSAWSVSPTGSGSRAGPSTRRSGNEFGCTPTTRSESSAWRRRCTRQPRSPACTMRDSTAPAITAAWARRQFHFRPVCSPLRRCTSR